MDGNTAGGNTAVLRTVAELRQQVAAWRRAGARVALVPTMGALHEGHLALVRRGAALCDKVVASIFVNPTQFGADEDFDTYPRQDAEDIAKLAALGAAAYLPAVAEMYPEGETTTVTVGEVTEGLCGAFRPGHFQGVATVVNKLLLQCLPDVALFGEKDYQQLLTITRMARDLWLPVDIVGVETVRDADGLALSSRNGKLSPDERRRALTLPATLAEMVARLRDGHGNVETVRADGLARLEAGGFDAIDYLEVCDSETLASVHDFGRPARVLGAVHLGETRLIDNMAV